MSVRGHNNVGRAVQTDSTLLRYASAITEQKKCWELLAEKFDRFQTLRNNMQQGVQTDATCNIQQCCVHLHGALVGTLQKAPVPDFSADFLSQITNEAITYSACCM